MGVQSASTGAINTVKSTTETEEDRSGVLKEAVSLTMEAAYGLEKINEQQIGQVLGNLVRTRLLSADDSYRLRDQLLDSNKFRDLLDGRIENTLKRRGLFQRNLANEINATLSNEKI